MFIFTSTITFHVQHITFHNHLDRFNPKSTLRKRYQQIRRL